MRLPLLMPLLACTCSPHPFVYILEPAAGTIYQPGDTVHVTATVEAPVTMDQVVVEAWFGDQRVALTGNCYPIDPGTARSDTDTDVADADDCTRVDTLHGTFVIERSAILRVTVDADPGSASSLHRDGAHVSLCIAGDTTLCPAGTAASGDTDAGTGDTDTD